MLAAANRIAPRVLIQWKRCNTSWVPKHISDKYGIPERPTWSVHELLSSYPSPKLSQETIQKLHRLSALTCPAEDTSEYKTRKENLEEMIRLVEAVRLVDTTGVEIRGRGEEEDADRTNVAVEADIGGQRLLKHASRTQDGFYVVDSERRS